MTNGWLSGRVSTGLKNLVSNEGDVLSPALCFLKAENYEVLVTPNPESNFIRDTGDQDSYII